MKLLVLGRHGQLAQSLAERATAGDRAELTMCARPEVDLMIPGSAAEAIRSSGASVIVNAAAFTAVDDAESNEAAAFRINGEAVCEIAEAASEAGARLIHISTDYVFDGESDAPYREDAATNPMSVYGRSKLAGEEAVRAAGGDNAILRTAWVYSPFGRNFVRTMMSAAEQRDRLRVVDDQRGSPTSALDLADAILALAGGWASGKRAGCGRTYHVAGSGETSWCGLARAIMDERRRLGLRAAEVDAIATADWPTPARRPRNSVLDSRRFAEEIGFTMPDWRRSLRPVVERIAAAPQD